MDKIAIVTGGSGGIGRCPTRARQYWQSSCHAVSNRIIGQIYAKQKAGDVAFITSPVFSYQQRR